MNSIKMHRWLPLVFYTILITYLSLSSGEDLPARFYFEGIDKVAHFLMYLGFAFLLAHAFHASEKGARWLTFIILMAFLYGVLMEVLQRTMTNGRQFDFMDMMFNLIGAIFGLILYRLLLVMFGGLIKKFQ